MSVLARGSGERPRVGAVAVDDDQLASCEPGGGGLHRSPPLPRVPESPDAAEARSESPSGGRSPTVGLRAIGIVYPGSTATPKGLVAPVMKLWSAPVPSRFARPIVPASRLVQ